MCRVCSGNPPDQLSFRDFEKQAIEALHNVSNQTLFLDQAKRIDRLRFDTGAEWGEPTIFRTVGRLIFSNPDPDEGLLLFTLSCWLDMQAPFITVWTTYLRQAKNWIDGKGSVPRGKYPATTPHLLLTRKTIQTQESISQWFVQKITGIAEKHGRASGNLYRLAGEVCNDLYSKSGVVDSLRNGVLPNSFSGGDHKRFWMYMMFLRRDSSVVKCLFTRALSKFDNGQRAVEYWYDPEYFNPIECELPVDRRVSANWNGTFEKLKMLDFQTENTSNVAKKARSFARENGFSPSVLDAILFYSGTNRVNV
jgi:hypothetical protein